MINKDTQTQFDEIATAIIVAVSLAVSVVMIALLFITIFDPTGDNIYNLLNK